MSSPALRRIIKDVRELERNPVPGVSLCPLENDLFKIHGNILINSGPYRGVYLHLHINLPENYPHTAPEMFVDSNIPFDHRFHGHVHPDSKGRLSVCNDMTSNFMATFSSKKLTGWSSGCTLSSLMINTIIFFSDPDLEIIPESSKIDNLKAIAERFICGDCGGCRQVMGDEVQVSASGEKSDIGDGSRVEEIAKVATVTELKAPSNNEDTKSEAVLEALTCYSCKENSGEQVIGYPVNSGHNKYRLFFSVNIEPLCYDCYRFLPSGTMSTTAFGSPYNKFLPLILESSVNMNDRKNVLLDCLQLLPSRPSAAPHTIMDSLEYVIQMANNIVIDIFKGDEFNSMRLIEGFCQLLQIAVFLLKLNKECFQHLKRQVASFKTGDRSKEFVPDIGVFLMKVFLSGLQYQEMKAMFLEEYFARQVFWMRRDDVNEDETRVNVRLSEVFTASKVSNGLYMVLYNVFTTFINEATIRALDESYGTPTLQMTTDLQSMVNKMKNDINSFSQYVDAIDATDVLPDDKAVFDLLNKAVSVADAQGYLDPF